MSNIWDKGYRQTTKVDVRITAPEPNKYSAAPKIIDDILRSASTSSNDTIIKHSIRVKKQLQNVAEYLSCFSSIHNLELVIDASTINSYNKSFSAYTKEFNNVRNKVYKQGVLESPDKSHGNPQDNYSHTNENHFIKYIDSDLYTTL